MQKEDKITFRLFDYFVFGNIFIAVSAVLMAYYTFAVFDAPINYRLLGFIFFASISSYSFHAYLPTTTKDYSEKVTWSLGHRRYLVTLLVLGVIGSAIFLFYLKQDLRLILTLIVFTILYSSPKIKFEKFTFFKKFGTAKTLYLAAMWTLVTVSLPLSAMDSYDDKAGVLLFINRFLLIYGICILFDLKDKEYDIERGIKSIITILDDKKVDVLFHTCIILFFLSSLLFYIFRNSGMVVFTLIVPGALLFFSLRKSKETKSDYWFSFLLDGLMMLSPILYLILYSIRIIFT